VLVWAVVQFQARQNHKIVMKRNVILPLGLLAAGVLAVMATCRAAVYCQGIYSAGTSYFPVCSIALHFPPFSYKLTEISWLEDANGLTVMSIERKAKPGDVAQRTLQVECGSESFFVPFDSTPTKRFRSRDDPPTLKGSGDFTLMLTQCATNRGGHPITNALPVIQVNWIRASQTNEDIFVLEDDHFTEAQNLLQQAYGKPDETISSTESSGGKCGSISYTPAQTGVFLNLASTCEGTTILSIIGKQK
jgi:hypothetical protein